MFLDLHLSWLREAEPQLKTKSRLSVAGVVFGTEVGHGPDCELLKSDAASLVIKLGALKHLACVVDMQHCQIEVYEIAGRTVWLLSFAALARQLCCQHG